MVVNSNISDDDRDIQIYERDNMRKSSKDNLKGKISMILLNMPEEVSDLAKVRYIYKNFGNMFCYDYGIVANDRVAGVKVDYENIAKFQTCTQIAEILAVGLSGINGNIETSVIPRTTLNSSNHNYDHMATTVKFNDRVTGLDYNLLLDLTLDLYRIQSGMQTKQFGFTTDANSTYDIISLNECRKLDEELGLVPEEGYTDVKIERVKNEITKMDEIKTIDKLKYMWARLGKTFQGPHEARQYFENILRECIKNRFKICNMYYQDVSTTEFESLFIILDGNDEICLLVDNNFGILKTDANSISNMVKLGWKTTSGTLNDVLGYDPYDNSNDSIKL